MHAMETEQHKDSNYLIQAIETEQHKDSNYLMHAIETEQFKGSNYPRRETLHSNLQHKLYATNSEKDVFFTSKLNI